MPSPRRSLTLLLLIAGGLGASHASTMQAGGDDFLTEVRTHFAGWDADHDGTLSATEIERALADPAVTGPAAAAAATLRRSFYAYPKFRPITLATLTAAVDHGPIADASGKPPPYEAMFEADLRKIQRTKRALFVSGLPRVETLGQGHLGDCFLLAPVGTVAACEPERMKQMVTELPGGKVAVHFGGDRIVTVAAPTDGEVVIGANAAGGANDGVWGNLFEKAIGQVMLDRQKASRAATPYQLIGVGGTPNVPLTILTGHKCKRVGCEDFQKAGKLDAAARAARLDAVRDELSAAFKAGRLVVGGTGEIHGGAVVVPGLYYDHSYGVLGYDRGRDVVTFWNPMGNGYKPKGPSGLEHGYPTSHGRFECPLADAVMWFGSFSIETDQAGA